MIRRLYRRLMRWLEPPVQDKPAPRLSLVKRLNPNDIDDWDTADRIMADRERRLMLIDPAAGVDLTRVLRVEGDTNRLVLTEERELLTETGTDTLWRGQHSDLLNHEPGHCPVLGYCSICHRKLGVEYAEMKLLPEWEADARDSMRDDMGLFVENGKHVKQLKGES